MINLKQFHNIIPVDQCSRSQFAAQRDKLAKRMRTAGHEAVTVASRPLRRRGEMKCR